MANAGFKEGKSVQAFPFYGIERRGSPVWAFTRIDTKPINARGQIYEPTVAVVLDSYLIEALDITQGLPANGIIVLNTDKKSSDFDFSKKFKVFCCDATSIAIKHGLGTKIQPIVNTTILGAFSKATGIVKLESIIEAMPEKVSVNLEKNIEAAKEAYNNTKNI